MLVTLAMLPGPGQSRAAALAGDGPTLPKPPEKLSWDVLPEPDFHEQGSGDGNRPFFNDYSWRTFIALNWPATGKRGEADATRKFGDTSVQTVWESWKSVAELFPADAAKNPPAPWEDFAERLWVRVPEKFRPNKLMALKAGKTKLLARISKLEDVNQAGFNVFEFPLVAQNKTYIRYEIRLNRIAYDFVRANKFYLRATLDQLPPDKPAEFPDQSINVKGAWMELPDDENIRRRFYHVRARVLDWDKKGQPILSDRTVGLIGFHIVHKTPKRKNWIWSTFEHLDNTDGPTPSLSSKAGLKPGPTTNKHPAKIVAGQPIPTPAEAVEVTRRAPVHPITEAINKAYQEHPLIKYTVWKNYRLIATQWPTPPGNVPDQHFHRENATGRTSATHGRTG
jgi:hypothetical protein